MPQVISLSFMPKTTITSPKNAVHRFPNSLNASNALGETTVSITSIFTWESSLTASAMLNMANQIMQKSANCSDHAGTLWKKYRPATITRIETACAVNSRTQTKFTIEL